MQWSCSKSIQVIDRQYRFAFCALRSTRPRPTRGFSRPSLPEACLYSTVSLLKTCNIFSYTSGRFLYNEKQRLEERYVEFDVGELHAAAERSVNHGHVVRMDKLAEGHFNRIFLLQMEDGFELIAKIPYRISGPAFLATASEAATMTYLRAKGIPVPKVYGYNARSENPVRSEYILQEKAPGVSAAGQWLDFVKKKPGALMTSVVELEKKLFDLPFGASGSIYFKNDLPRQQQAPLYASGAVDAETQTFCIGPIADRRFWQGRRASLQLDRGPWLEPVKYLQAIALKEIEDTEKYGKPMEPVFPYRAIGGYGVQQPGDFIRSLKDYLALTPHLLPQRPAHPFNRPTIRHPDMTPENIFVDPETCRVSCLVDWQHTIVQPQSLAAGCPDVFEELQSPIKFRALDLPEELSELPEEEHEAARAFALQQTLYPAYLKCTSMSNKLHADALADPRFGARKLLVWAANKPWTGDNVTLRRAVINMARGWEHLPELEGLSCPIQLDEAEIEKFEEQEESWDLMTVANNMYRERLCNVTEQGWVRHEDFERAQQEREKLEQETWSQCEGDADDERAFKTGWPFRDHDEEA